MGNIKAIFGANIKYYRKKQNLSQDRLSEMLGITPKHLSTIETGAAFVSAELLEKFSKELHVSVSTLFYSDGEISNDDSMIGMIDQIIDRECAKTSSSIKLQIRHLTSM